VGGLQHDMNGSIEVEKLYFDLCFGESVVDKRSRRAYVSRTTDERFDKIV
jgi:hypothetical protein